MELLDGVTVESLNERSRLPLGAVCSIGLQALEVLEAAHDRGVVHRDIKPANLFATREGALKILDFGIARLREPGATSGTQTGLMLGTPAFMAPEQAIGRMSQIDGRTDLWALGATLFTLISGQPVHEAETLQEALVKAATEPVRSLRVAAPKTPSWLVSVVDRALSFDQNARFATAHEMHTALALYAKDATPAALAALVEKADSRASAHPSRRPRPSATHAAVVTPATAGKRSLSGWLLLIVVVAGVGVGFAKWADYVEVQRAAGPSAPAESEPLVRRTEGPDPSLPEAASASAVPSASAAPAPQKSAGASRRRAPAPSGSAQRVRRNE